MTVAALGGSVEVPTLDGPETVEIEPGTQPGEVVRLRGRGMPHLNGRGRGELVGLLKVETPTKLTDEEKEILVRFAGARGEQVGSHEQGFLGKIKGAFK
jgi:molecular chaperone DnaJ